MAPPPPPADPLTVSRELADAADLRAWLTTPELAQLLRMAPARFGAGAPATTAPGPASSWCAARMALRFGGRWYVCDAPNPTLALEHEGTVAS